MPNNLPKYTLTKENTLREDPNGNITFVAQAMELANLHSADAKTAWAECEALREKVAALEAALSAAEPVKPVCHLVWMQGMRGPDDVEDYFLVAEPGDKGVDGSDAFPVYAAPPAPSVAVKALKAIANYRSHSRLDSDENAEAMEEIARSALSAQVQDVAGTVEAFDRDHPELYWHIAKGKVTAGEPLYGAIITDLRGKELGDGESNVSAVDAFNIAVDDAALPAAPAKQEGKP